MPHPDSITSSASDDYQRATQPDPEGCGKDGDDGGFHAGPLSRFPSFTHALPACMFLCVCAAVTIYAAAYKSSEQLMVSGDSLFARREYWRLFTSLLVHSGVSHLLANAPVLLVFGWMLKAYFGAVVFPVISLAVGMVTNLIVATLYPPYVYLCGASGMGYGMVGIWLVLYVRHDIRYSVSMRLFRAAGFSLIMLIPSGLDPNVSYLAHAGGFILGIIAGCSLIPLRTPREPS